MSVFKRYESSNQISLEEGSNASVIKTDKPLASLFIC